jgi:1-acyl-sn-glycerol-3-phosphate acyltransferase
MSIKRRVTYLAKDYLFKHWLVGWVLRSIGAYPIKTATDDFRTVRDLIRILNGGNCLTIFPEGTRSEDGKFKSVEGGVGFLAMKSQAYVVPVYIEGSYDAYPKGAKKVRLRPIRVYFGDAYIPALDEKLKNAPDPYQAIANDIMDKIKGLKSAVSR